MLTNLYLAIAPPKKNNNIYYIWGYLAALGCTVKKVGMKYELIHDISSGDFLFLCHQAGM